MISHQKLNILNDPIYGFITIPDTIIFELIEDPLFQRLRRISQMGLSYLVYPGANHTRFHHALGCMFLMQKVVQVLHIKGVDITLEEEEALYIAILLHDIGHGPFSHAMENSIVEGISHEEISLLLMEHLNKKFNGRLTLAIQIFKGLHDKQFLCQLISGQLDMDRLDYLKRDSFYAGTPEGNINSERLITMLNVVNNELVVEEKGVYSIEKFIIARRFMYWQVYLHKTSIVGEQILINILIRAKELIKLGKSLNASKSLIFFLTNNISKTEFDEDMVLKFSELDDFDIIAAVKEWKNNDDFVLSNLCERLLNRNLLKIKVKEKPFSDKDLNSKLEKVIQNNKISKEEASYFAFRGSITNLAYSDTKQKIKLLTQKGKVIDITAVSDQINSKALTKVITKNYLCYPKSKD
ncbi:HD domain-containing protein [Planktosalinus lacus]|uniref:Phosphohydrolase n=1 Tax=Planktosalinus lacus TaxID=1526573 RepID=A0A8J2VAD3_9FLAO|nr:HD domain-containing protein [Planktosalinus lacus]GGD94320.1 phosphohydrolase [Planktosalinus lacus]